MQSARQPGSVYIYPDKSYTNTGDQNPYINDLMTSFERKGYKVIRSKTAFLGSVDFFFHLRKMDILVCSWVEESANGKFGYVKAVALAMALPLLRLFKVKLVWTIHNRQPHTKEQLFWSKWLSKLLFLFADLIVAHARSGTEVFGVNQAKITYYPHPFRDAPEPHPSTPEKEALSPGYDILIWGRIQSYKGIYEFLQYLRQTGLADKYAILIQGKCADMDLWNRLVPFEGDRIKLRNRHIPPEELNLVMASAKCVLFTHTGNSTLSSGALIESLSYGKTVIGPDMGNFKDFREDAGIVLTYGDYDELVNILNQVSGGGEPLVSAARIRAFADQYTWDDNTGFLLEKIL